MKNMKSLWPLTGLTIFLLGMHSILWAQYIDSLTSFGDFGSAAAFTVDESGRFFVLDKQNSKLLELDTSGTILAETGGFGWDTGLFDSPSDVSCAPLRVIVCDKNNHRLQFFDRSLASLGVLKNTARDEQTELFRFPVSASQNNQGDLFIVDSDNKRIVKIDALGSRASTFGGMNFGIYTLATPLKIKKALNEQMAVLDGKRIVFFDNFGNGTGILQTPGELVDFWINEYFIIGCTGSEIYIYSDITHAWEMIARIYELDSPIIGVCANENTIFILRGHCILRLQYPRKY